MSLRDLGNINGPFQEDMTAVSMVKHDIRGGTQGFGQTIRTLQRRDKKISIIQLYDSYVMPHLNAGTKISSGHIVRIWDSTPPPRAQFRYCVDLYILDENLYIAAFRRRRITIEEVEAGVDDDVGCGRWFCFKDMVDKVPAFLDAESIEMISDHGNACPGGEIVLEDMLYSLARFETEDGQAGDLNMQVKKALWNAMVVYCETRRLRSLLIEMYKRIQLGWKALPLSKNHWSLIHGWSNFSTLVLCHRKQGTLSLDTPLPHWITNFHQMKTMNDLIGIYGELLMIKLDKSELGKTDEEFNLHWMSPGAWNVPEPGIQMQF